MEAQQEIMQEAINNLAVSRLMSHVVWIEQQNDPQRIEEYDVMVQALSYLLDPEFMVEWSTRDINPEWLNTVAANA